jgi:hypothetical protein
VFLYEEHSRDFSKFPTGAIENMHFIFSKSVEFRLASSAGGREEPILSLSFKLHLLLKVCQHYNVYTNKCTCVSIFTNIFFEGVKLAH